MVKKRMTKLDKIPKKSKLRAVYNNGGDWKQLAYTEGINLKTAYSWLKENDESEDKRGGSRRIKITQDVKDEMVELIELNPRITLKLLAEEIGRKFNMTVSIECMRKHLNTLMYSLKAMRFEPEAANNDINKDKRKIFVENLLSHQSNDAIILFMDESNFNLHISRSQGRSIIGTRCTSLVSGSKGPNIHVIGCIGSKGLIHCEVRRGSFTKLTAIEWFKTCLRKANEIYKSEVVIVIDNAPCHSKIEEILDEEEFKLNKMLRLGPYSPMLNPIENIWSQVKAEVKSNLANRMSNILNDAVRNGLGIGEFRLRKLEEEVWNCLKNVTPADCVKYIAKIQGLFSSVINKENVKF